MGYKQQLEQKRKRDIKLYQYHLDHPQIGVRALGRIFKISGSRVSQIIRGINKKGINGGKNGQA